MVSHLLLERYIPLSMSDELRGQFEHLQQDRMSVTEYEMGFTKLSRHVAFLIYGIRITMARESKIGTTFHKETEISRRIERVLG